MTGNNRHLSILTLNVHGLNAPIKRHRISNWVKKQDPKREGNLKLGCGRCAHCGRVNIVILNWQRPLWEGDQEVVKRSGRDDPMWVAIHMCMEPMLGISLYSYLYLK
jgi:hypothetical protein